MYVRVSYLVEINLVYSLKSVQTSIEKVYSKNGVIRTATKRAETSV